MQMTCGAFLAVFGGSFWVDHLGVTHLTIYGLSVHAFGLMYIIFGARDLFLINRIDYSAPVLDLQSKSPHCAAGINESRFGWSLRGVSFGFLSR